MKQFLLPRRYGGETRITLSGDEFPYLTPVLRKREGDALPAITWTGTRYAMRIEKIRHSGCTVVLAADPPDSGVSVPQIARIRLLQCLPKGRKMDLIARQAVDAGVSRIVPLVSEHTVAVPEDPAARLFRWRRIAREALQQSGNAGLPAIDEPTPLLKGAVLEGARDTGHFFHQERLAEDSLHGAVAGVGPSGTVSLLIGPEGGLSEPEVEHLRSAGFRAVFLGDAVLRAETAAIYAIAAVKTLLRERDTWKLSK
jgi:16S rRNA (uracil1498-N3)-methyltransferase